MHRLRIAFVLLRDLGEFYWLLVGTSLVGASRPFSLQERSLHWVGGQWRTRLSRPLCQKKVPHSTCASTG